MKKKVGILVLVLLLLMSNTQIAYAHPNQAEHDADLSAVLFGLDNNLSGEQKQVFQDIADAAALCIDQFSKNELMRTMEKSTFDPLNERIGFSFSFDDIDLKKGNGGALVNVEGSNHRRYTHRGWTFNYSSKEANHFWTLRKRILTATVNKELFNTSPGLLAKVPWGQGWLFSEDACNKQCEAFCELIYYVHILGDYEKGITASIFSQTVPLVRHEDPNNPALIKDLIDLMPELFKSQTWSYPSLQLDLEEIEVEAEKLYTDWGGIRTQEQRDQCCELAEKVLKLLKERVPGLLKNEDFFANVFYVSKAA